MSDLDRGIFFDEDYQIRILDVDKFQASKSLEDNTNVFMANVQQLQELVNKYITAIDAQVAKIEAEKLRAVGLRNQVSTLNEERKRKQRELEQLLAEKQEELERLQIEEQSLIKTRQEQELLILKLSDSGQGAAYS